MPCSTYYTPTPTNHYPTQHPPRAEIDSNNWGSQQIEVKTDWKNPALGMLMGYVIAKEISPDDILDKVSVF